MGIRDAIVIDKKILFERTISITNCSLIIKRNKENSCIYY